MRLYIERCELQGIAPRASKIANALQGDRHSAVGKSFKESQKLREREEKKREQEFQRSPWRYVAGAYLILIPLTLFGALASLSRFLPFSLFFPYRANVQSPRRPYLTVLVCIICIIVFICQMVSNSRYQKRNEHFYKTSISKEECDILGPLCHDPHIFEFIRRHGNKDQYAIIKISHEVYSQWQTLPKIYTQESYEPVEVTPEMLTTTLTTVYQRYRNEVSRSFTDLMLYMPNRLDISGIYTSQLTHASFDHIGFNLVFFVAFAASVEIIAGSAFYLAMFLIVPAFIALTWGTHELIKGDDITGALGLSGMCTAFMGALLVLMPHLQIKTFLFLLVWSRRLLVPVWFLALWFVGWDIQAMVHNPNSHVNHLAHVTGALTGGGLALAYRTAALKLKKEDLIYNQPLEAD